jgi:crotonobetainyl-CoA:carnitine CoA-transferase CaiB-like acyl-CoA transferase
MTRVLAGVKVVELGTFITGPYAAMLLAELGAEVIKVEQPCSGDPFRGYRGGLYSPQFCAYNAGKRSLSLDLKSSDAIQALLKLVQTADVLIENFRPDVLNRLGLDSERVRQINPRLIFCSITGFGAEGPYANRPCYDTVAQAMSGYLSQFLDTDAPAISGPAVADAITGMYAANGILGALVERSRTGRGRRLEVAMLDAMVAFNAEPFANYFATGVAPTPRSRPAVSQAYAVPCADRKLIALHLASVDRFWSALVTALGRTDLSADPRFSSHEARTKNYAELRSVLAEIFAARPRGAWLERLVEHDVPHAAVATLDEVASDAHVVQKQLIRCLEHPTQGLLRKTQSPMIYDGARETGDLPPPMPGEHTRAILAELGYDAEAISRITDGKL